MVLIAAGEPPLHKPMNCPQEPIETCVIRHGRFSTQNGTAQIIWLIGTHRVVRVDNDAEGILPANVLRYTEMTSANHSYVFGDFTVCPIERERPGYMRSVCVADAKNIVVEVLDHSRPTFRVRSTWQ
jgi:hypothetical protein